MSTYLSGLHSTDRKKESKKQVRTAADRQADLRTKFKCARKPGSRPGGAEQDARTISCVAQTWEVGETRQVGMLSQQLGLGKIRDGLEIANRGPTGSYAVPGGAPTTIITLSSTCLANQIPDCASRVTPAVPWHVAYNFQGNTTKVEVTYRKPHSR